jgi:chromosomal replication initiator protein
MTADLWQRGCERLAAELPEQQFNTWIRPLAPADVTERGEAGTVASLRVPNRFKLDWIRSQYASRIEGVLSDLAGRPVRLELALAPREGAMRNADEPVRAGAATNATPAPAPPTRWRARPHCTSPVRQARCTTRCSSTAASAWARRT